MLTDREMLQIVLAQAERRDLSGFVFKAWTKLTLRAHEEDRPAVRTRRAFANMGHV